ncbi:hypothetical protein FQA39_LY05505 [Lamprigera yunnana]|nr:hypothetical protein FQA39_LY05505 [Lamprigera yunnana]
MANVKKKQTREERLEKKGQAEKFRYQRIKNDPVKNAELKEKEKGQIKSINDMTKREQRAVRKIWREKIKKHRDRVKLQSTRNYPVTPSASGIQDSKCSDTGDIVQTNTEPLEVNSCLVGLSKAPKKNK